MGMAWEAPGVPRARLPRRSELANRPVIRALPPAHPGDDVICVAKNDAVLDGLLTVFHAERSTEGLSNVQNDLPLLSDYDKECLHILAQEFEVGATWPGPGPTAACGVQREGRVAPAVRPRVPGALMAGDGKCLAHGPGAGPVQVQVQFPMNVHASPRFAGQHNASRTARMRLGLTGRRAVHCPTDRLPVAVVHPRGGGRQGGAQVGARALTRGRGRDGEGKGGGTGVRCARGTAARRDNRREAWRWRSGPCCM